MRRPILILALLVLCGVALGLRLLPAPWPWSPGGPKAAERLPPAGRGAPAPDGDRVPAAVRLLGRDVSGWPAERLRAWLTTQANRFQRDPVSAQLDPVTRGVIPQVDGFSLDVEATIRSALTAEPGAEVQPVLRWRAAARTLDDFPLAPLYRGNPSKRAVTFLINVAWGNEELVSMLQILDEKDVGATFFLVGRWAEANPELARRVAAYGHEIANHGYSDAISIGRAGYAQARDDLERAHRTIVQVTGHPPRYFSPHRGELSETLLQVCRDLGYRLVMWTVDTIDWQDPPRQRLLERVFTKVDGGSLILMHPRAVTVEALPALIDGLRQRGLEPVPLSTLLDARSFLEPEGSEAGATSPDPT